VNNQDRIEALAELKQRQAEYQQQLADLSANIRTFLDVKGLGVKSHTDLDYAKRLEVRLADLVREDEAIKRRLAEIDPVMTASLS
jgi:hypothetical protein